MKYTYPLLFILFISLFSNQPGYAYNLKQLSGREGLSNSAVIHIMQDSERIMWIGTYDGLNLYDGINIDIYKPTGREKSIAGNIIRRILETEKNTFWIQTNLGITKFHKEQGVLNTYLRNNFQIMAKNSKNQVFSVIQTDSIFMYNPLKDLFVPYSLDSLYREVIRHFSFDSNDVLWILNLHGVLKRYKIETDENEVLSVVNIFSFDYPERIRYAFAKQDQLFVIGDKGSLSVIDRKNGSIRFIRNLSDELNRYGIVGDIIGHDNDILVALSTNGVLRLYPNSLGEYEIEKIDLDCGVFSFYKDEEQNIIWFGTDGQGAVLYSKDAHSFKSETFNNWYDLVRKPVRALFLDRENNLWIGTKGDGILKRNNYKQSGGIQLEDLTLYRMENSDLVNNSVFTFAPGSRDLLWIGSDGPGLNYYSYRTGKIHPVESTSSGNLNFTQTIYQQNDTVLWVGSSGDGLAKVNLIYKENKPVIKQIRRKRFFESNNKYFSVIPENDSILWIASRLNGAVRYNTNTDKHQVICFEGEEEQLMNDILCVFKDSRNTIWFGTSLGLIRLLSFEEGNIRYENYNELNGLPNNTVHGILESNDHTLWLSTNNGIIEFNYENGTFKHVNYKNGIDIFEFCDNAYYRPTQSDILFFGGVNGLISVVPDENEKQVYLPDISFYGLKIYGKDVYMNEYLKTGKNKTWLELPYNSNFFSISYIAIDYLNASNYTYEYKLENFSDQWIFNGASNVASFTNIPPGNYNLLVRYRNSSIRENGDIYSFPIVITPPWYYTTAAYLVYFILSLIAGVILARIVRKWYEMKKGVVISKLKQEQKEKIYESQFRFFTNITHELCTPLTLIQGPAEKIVEYEKADPYVHKYALLIQRNVEKLNQLIHELIDFRRIETGHKKTEFTRLDLSEQTRELTGAFSELAESKKIIYQVEIEQEVFWNTDTGCYTRIVNNLLSNAFKYVNPQGKVVCKLYRENGQLVFTVSNTGEGIKPEDISRIFDRYRILDNFGMQTKGSRPVRNGLGLAICYNMVELLKGEITVTSFPEEWTTFKVTFPELTQATGEETLTCPMPDKVHTMEDPDQPVVECRNFDPDKATILIVDDDEEVLWFVTELFVEQYNIVPLADTTKVMEFLRSNRVNLILMDIMMPGIDGLTLTKEIKADKLLSPIPLILLSAKGNHESKTEGIDSGAEMYITKPFHTHYLEKAVDRLLRRKEEMKEYYNSSLSSFLLEEGRLISKENKAFYTKLMKIIEENISNPDFSVEILSASLGVSSRHLYRRLKEITDKTPNELIRDYRFKKAEKLLATTTLSVDEIIYDTGFNNRGNFFRLFSQRYGTTPKKYREEALRKVKK